MTPAGRGETESLHFPYPHFDAPDPAARDSPRNLAPVAIAGAGPIGMTAALALAKEGVRSVVFDDKSSFNDGSRAICIARPGFYILEQIGAIAPFPEKALPWTTGRTVYRGRQILEFHIPDGPAERYRPMCDLQQQYIEPFLWQAVEASELIEIRWRSEVIGVEDTADGARLAVRDPAGDYAIEASWVLACDGADPSGHARRRALARGERRGSRGRVPHRHVPPRRDPMNHQDLEGTYAALALEIDEVGEAGSEPFLAKLVLLLTQRNGDADEIRACIDEAAASRD